MNTDLSVRQSIIKVCPETRYPRVGSGATKGLLSEGYPKESYPKVICLLDCLFVPIRSCIKTCNVTRPSLQKTWRQLSRVLHSFWRSNFPTGPGCSMWPMRLYMLAWLIACLCGSGLASKPETSLDLPYKKHGGNFRAFLHSLILTIEFLYRRRSMGPMRLY